MTTNWTEEEYQVYEDRFDPMQHDRAARRKRKPRVAQKRVTQREVVETMADAEGLEVGFETTYKPSRFETRWLLTSLETFYEQGLITDVLAQIKGGKEASVYRCQAHPATGAEFLAAKVYRPRAVRNLRNDKVYRQGRETLTDGGRVVKQTDSRVMRAIGKKSDFGMQVRHTSWLLYEYLTLRDLYEAGGAVPRPWAAGENAILMEYIGDAARPAPTLHEVELGAEEAEPLYREMMRNVELMASKRLVHGDLSAYNALYWEGEITLIDFPQVIDMDVNKSARKILARDIQRVCDYFQRQGVASDASAITAKLWKSHGLERDPAMEELAWLVQNELLSAGED